MGMYMDKKNTNVVKLHRVMKAKPERVYRAFLDPDAMAKWLPPHGFTGKVHSMDAKVGGTYKMSISDWMRQIRLAKAYARVVSGESIKAVAYDLGFKQLSHFSRVFKEVHGVAPSFISPRGRAKAAAATGASTAVAEKVAPFQILTMPGLPLPQTAPVALENPVPAVSSIAV